MESYQLIIDVISNEKNINEEPYSILFNIFECYKLDFIKKLTTVNINDFNKDLNEFLQRNKINTNNIKIKNSKYKLKLFINKFLNTDIKYIRANNSYDINIEYLMNEDDNVIGIKINQYYYINKTNLELSLEQIDKKVISEWCKFCITNNIWKNNNQLIYFNNIIWNYENSFKKLTNKDNNIDILPYINLYNSLLLRYDIYMNDETKTNKIITFLPVSRYTCKNLFIKYQKIFNIFNENNNNNKLITFKNPKNEQYFKSDTEKIDTVDTNFYLSLRLYCSKMNNLESTYYRKTTEKLDMTIKLLIKKKRIIGIKFGNIDYYIWKKDGNLLEYELYNDNFNYHELVVKTFKDACVFFFKL
jgi:hypothetical protein